MLTTIIVVMGINIFTCALLMMLSPGRRPNGTLTSQGQRSPTRMTITPIVIRIFCMVVNGYALEIIVRFNGMQVNDKKSIYAVIIYRLSLSLITAPRCHKNCKSPAIPFLKHIT